MCPRSPDYAPYDRGELVYRGYLQDDFTSNLKKQDADDDETRRQNVGKYVCFFALTEKQTLLQRFAKDCARILPTNVPTCTESACISSFNAKQECHISVRPLSLALGDFFHFQILSVVKILFHCVFTPPVVRVHLEYIEILIG